MASWTNSDVSRALVQLTAPEIQAGQNLYSSSSAYSILEFIGEGCFGKVAKCQNLATKERVAVKILKKDSDYIQDTKNELSILKLISILNPDHVNVVKFFEQFDYMGQTCLAFEMLDSNLYELLQERNWRHLSLSEIRPIAKQLLVALDALKGLGILHTDIKPDNVMFVNKQDQPLRVKLIDFGNAISASAAKPGLVLQPVGYRAPEVTLGFRITEAIDVWGVGCVLAFLYLADNLFPVNCEYQMIKFMVEILGQPWNYLFSTGKYIRNFFSKEQTVYGPIWKLKTEDEYAAATKQTTEKCKRFIEISSLDDLVHIYPKTEAAECEDQEAFVDILKMLLNLYGDHRISPHQALQHPFITMSHLTKRLYSRAYLTTSQTMMSICLVEDTVNSVNTSASSATGFCVTPSGIKFDALTTWSSERAVKSWSYGEDVRTWLSKAASPPFYDQDVEASSSNGEQQSSYCNKDTASFYSDGEVPPWYYNKGPTTRSSYGELPPCYYNKDPASWSSDGELSYWYCNEDPASCFRDKKLPPWYYNKDPAMWSSVGELPPWYYNKDPAMWSSVGELPPCAYDKDPAAWSSGGKLQPGPYDPYDKDPADWSSGGKLPPGPYDPYDKDPADWSSGGKLQPCPYDEEPATCSLQEANATELLATASASSCRRTKLLKRIRQFFGQIASTIRSCWHSPVLIIC